MSPLGITVRDGAVIVGPDHQVSEVGPDGLVGQLTPDGLPADPVPPVTLVVSGGLLAWPWDVGPDGLDPDATLTRPPVVVLEDVASAQEWLWALYGRDAALAAADAAAPPHTAAPTNAAVAPVVDCAPGLEWLPAAAARFAFGTWLSAWWPASTTDGIPALDPAVLRAELDPLGARLDLLFDGAGPPLPAVVTLWRPASDRYALAAGPAGDGPAAAVGVSVSTGVCGTWWSDLPPGWVDASDRAVSWRLLQDLDHWWLQVRAAAGPVVVATEARLVADTPGRRVELGPDSDAFGRCWLGEATGTEPGPAPGRVRLYLPGFAPENRAVRSAEHWHESVRALARTRLAAASTPSDPTADTRLSGPGPAVTDPWQAERTAATDDDY
ncbi:MAG: hypothetical protein FWH11_08730 [Micrococcales bacterium]|nr:hypothetical protein [Micrococcales bacterium]